MEKYTYVFTEIKEVVSWHYGWTIKNQNSGWFTSSGTNTELFSLLLGYFGVSTYAELTGKSFVSEKTEPVGALEHLILEIKNGGNYIPPSGAEVRYQAAQALANLTVPDFSHIDNWTVLMAFAPFWTSAGFNVTLLDEFKVLVSELSSGSVVLINDPYDEANGQVKHLRLVGNSLVVRVRMTATSAPIVFDAG